MGAVRTLGQRVRGSLDRLLGTAGGRPWRAVALLGAMVAVMVVVMLVASPGDEVDPFDSLLGAEGDTGGAGGTTAVVSGPDTKSPAPATEGSGGSTSLGSRPGSHADASDDTQGGGSEGSGSTAGGSAPSPGSPSGSQNENPLVVDTATGPAAPDNPGRLLDQVYGETMFPEEYPGLKLVLAFEGDDGEVTATYKSVSTTRFDIIRMTVQRTESDAAALAAIEDTLELYSPERATYTWGGRDITQAVGLLGASEGDPVLGFVWRQGRYCIDATVYSPYRDGIVAGRDAALDFIGRLGY